VFFNQLLIQPSVDGPGPARSRKVVKKCSTGKLWTAKTRRKTSVNSAEINRACSIDVKNVFTFFYSCHVFLRFNVFFIFSTFFYFLKKRSSKFENSTENIEKVF